MTDVDSILTRLLNAYANCHTYNDQGTVTHGGEHSLDEALWFRTTFVRKGPFKFEWGHSGRPNATGVVFFDGKQAFENDKNHPEKLKPVQSLSLALHRTSLGVVPSTYVPSLLMPGFLPDAEQLKEGPYELNERLEAGRNFDVLTRETKEATREIWISRSSGLIERIHNHRDVTFEEFEELKDAMEDVAPIHPGNLDKLDFATFVRGMTQTIDYLHGDSDVSKRSNLRSNR